MKTLTLTIKVQYFNEILSGTKTTEYREIKPFWTKKLEGKQKYDRIRMINGYSRNAPELIVELIKIDIEELFFPITETMEICYALRLDKILEVKNHLKKSA